MDDPLSGKCILVTGAARRVGATVVRALHDAGASIVLHYRHAEQDAQQLAATLNARRPDSVALVQADLLDLRQLPGLVDLALARFGRLDGLINNASSFYPTPVGSITEADWLDLMGTNLKAPLFLSQAAAGALKANRGAIINMADIHAGRPVKHHVVYSIAKAGVVTLTRALARELGSEVRVNAIAPGYILWPEDNPQFDAAARQAVIEHTALKRIGTPEDIAATILFLLSSAPFITGAVIPIDGGYSAGLD